MTDTPKIVAFTPRPASPPPPDAVAEFDALPEEQKAIAAAGGHLAKFLMDNQADINYFTCMICQRGEGDNQNMVMFSSPITGEQFAFAIKVLELKLMEHMSN
jgi:hypothetical protein